MAEPVAAAWAHPRAAESVAAAWSLLVGGSSWAPSAGPGACGAVVAWSIACGAFAGWVLQCPAGPGGRATAVCVRGGGVGRCVVMCSARCCECPAFVAWARRGPAVVRPSFCTGGAVPGGELALFAPKRGAGAPGDHASFGSVGVFALAAGARGGVRACFGVEVGVVGCVCFWQWSHGLGVRAEAGWHCTVRMAFPLVS